MIPGKWQEALIDIDRAAEFSGDDVDQFTKLVNLDMPFEFLTVLVPAVDSGAITPYVQKEPAVDTVPVPVHFFHDNNADTDVVQSTVADTGSKAITFNIGGNQFVRLKVAADQSADRSLQVRGFNRS